MITLLVRLLVLVATLCIARVESVAQCRWQVGAPTFPGPNGPVTNLITWDADGAGPQLENLVVIGNFTIAGDLACPGIAVFDGVRFVPIEIPAGSTGRPFGVVGNRLYAVLTIDGVRQLWYWDDQGPHFEANEPEGIRIGSVFRGQLLTVVNRRLSSYVNGVITPLTEPFPPDSGPWATNGEGYLCGADGGRIRTRGNAVAT